MNVTTEPSGTGRWAECRRRMQWGNLEADLMFLERTRLTSQPREILEIGCGKGTLLRQLTEWGHVAVGIDIEAGLLRDHSRDLAVCAASGIALPFGSNTFDVVLSFDVFEHMADSDRHLDEVARVLRPRGRYVLQTPNKWTNSIIEPIKFAERGGIRTAFDCFKPPFHCALHNYWQLRSRLHKHGFAPEFHDIPALTGWFRAKVRETLGPPGTWALALVNPDRFPLPFRTNFFVEATLLAK
jgi:SAM-dependent methyltransferase